MRQHKMRFIMLGLVAALAACADLPEDEASGWTDPRETASYRSNPRPTEYPYGDPEQFDPAHDDADRLLAARAPSLIADLDEAWPGDQNADWNRLQLFHAAHRALEAGLQKRTPIRPDLASTVYAALARLRASLGERSFEPRSFAASVLQELAPTLDPDLSDPLARLAMLGIRVETDHHRRIMDQSLSLTQAKLTFEGALAMEIRILEQELARLRQARISAEAAMTRNTNPYVMRIMAQEARIERQLQDLRRAAPVAPIKKP